MRVAPRPAALAACLLLHACSAIAEGPKLSELVSQLQAVGTVPQHEIDEALDASDPKQAASELLARHRPPPPPPPPRQPAKAKAAAAASSRARGMARFDPGPSGSPQHDLYMALWAVGDSGQRGDAEAVRAALAAGADPPTPYHPELCHLTTTVHHQGRRSTISRPAPAARPPS